MTGPPAATAVQWRLPLLATGGLALAAGLYSGLLLLGFRMPALRRPWPRCTAR